MLKRFLDKFKFKEKPKVIHKSSYIEPIRIKGYYGFTTKLTIEGFKKFLKDNVDAISEARSLRIGGLERYKTKKFKDFVYLQILELPELGEYISKLDYKYFYKD